jgi:hypothetical protein
LKNNKMLWLNFIHFYQPVNLETNKIKEASEKSYEPLLSLLEKNPQMRWTANLAGSLLERWQGDLERQDLIARIKSLVERGQLELVGSAAYHALLPLLRPEEVLAQIKKQEELLLKHFNFKPKGFFAPEMAYSQELLVTLKELGYQWFLADEAAFGPLGGGLPGQPLLEKKSGLRALARDRQLSESYVPQSLMALAADSLVVTATDAELYGLRHIDNNGFLEKLLNRSDLTLMTISDYLEKAETVKEVFLIDSNWQSSAKELNSGVPYGLWCHPRNGLHQDLWLLAGLAQDFFYRYQTDRNLYWSRWHLWRGLQSCAWWWASRHDFRSVFGPLAWSPDEIERGVNELLRSVRSLEASTSKEEKIKVEKIAHKIKINIWLKHW